MAECQALQEPTVIGQGLDIDGRKGQCQNVGGRVSASTKPEDCRSRSGSRFWSMGSVAMIPLERRPVG